MDDLAKDVCGTFEDYGVAIGKDKKLIYKKSAELCRKYSFNAEVFVGAWIAFSAINCKKVVEVRWLDALEKQVLSHCRGKFPEKKPSIHNPTLNWNAAAESKMKACGRKSSPINRSSSVTIPKACKMDDLAEDVCGKFEDYGFVIGKNKELIYKKSAELCMKYSLDAEDFVGIWITFAAQMGKDTDVVEVKWLDALEIQVLSHRRAKFAGEKPNVHISTANRNATAETKVKAYGQKSSEIDELQSYGKKNARTHELEKKNRAVDTAKYTFSPSGYSPAILASSVSYAARTKSGDTVLHYKCKDSDYWSEVSEGNQQSITVSPLFSTKSMMDSQWSFRHLVQKSTDIASAFNSVMVNMLGEDDMKELQDLRLSSVEECWYFGKVRGDEERRLTLEGTLFEGDLEFSGGHTVSIDLSAVDEYRLFPGQIVILKGQNYLGKCLRVSEVFVPAPLPLREISSNKTRSLTVMLASGPFNPSDSMKLEPLWDLLEVVKKDKPDVLVLAGPFIDTTHPMIGDLAETFEDVFNSIIYKIQMYIEGLETQVVIVSTCKEAHHHVVFPTPPYNVRKVDRKITFLPDPAMFEVAGVTIGFTTMDILKHLASSEIAKSSGAEKRMEGLSKQILQQANFYPLCPPDESVPLNCQLGVKFCQFKATPHILVLPSDLRYFIKEVEGVIVINPERLAKGKSGGTYARLQVKLPDGNVRSVAKFCCGEIVKI